MAGVLIAPLALVGVRLTDKQHDQAFIEHYIDVAKGSGQAFLDTLTTFGNKSKHPEIANAPLLLWGMSAGGEFNYEFTAWKPERVAAFVVNKGGIYYSALLPKAARAVPGILFIGGKDLWSRIDTIRSLCSQSRRRCGRSLKNRRGASSGSRWAWRWCSSKTRCARLGDRTNGAVRTRTKPLAEKMGLVGVGGKDAKPAAPTRRGTPFLVVAHRVAKAWQEMVSGQ